VEYHRGSTSVGYSLACTNEIRVKVNWSDKHSSLLRYENNNGRKKFNNTGPKFNILPQILVDTTLLKENGQINFIFTNKTKLFSLK
jgi:hypothetical protein